MKRIRKIITILAIVALILITGSCSRHTPDTNGSNNYALTSITLQDIITGNKCVKSGASRKKRGRVTDIRVKKFSGVETIQKIQLNGATLELSIAAKVNDGNLKVLLCNEHQILEEILVNKGVQTVTLPKMTDTVYLKVGGESADYSLSFEYDVTMSQGILI